MQARLRWFYSGDGYGDYATVLETANKTGREIHMVRGVWDVTENYKDGIVPWKVGFELVGYTGKIWDLASTSSMPTIFLGESSHIQILGKSPRSLTGFWIETDLARIVVEQSLPNPNI